MTEITFRKCGTRYTAEAHGHATRADGVDDGAVTGTQVCTAITACLDFLVGGVHLLAERHKAFDVLVSADKGVELVRASGDEYVNILFCSAYLALSLLARQHPERLRVEANENFQKFFRFS